jgi:hypothetical protein
MTQLEINLDTGLPTLTPYEDRGLNRLRLSPDVVVANKNAKCDLTSASISEADKPGLFISFYISPPDEKFNVMENLLTRGTESWDGDERFAEYRRHLATAMKTAVANGIAKLPPGYTMADLEKAKGVRWAQKAGCSCGCSPAYSTPLWSVGGQTGRWVNRKWKRRYTNAWMNVTLTPKQGQTVAMRVGRNAEAVAASIELRPVNKEAYEKVEAEMPSALVKG